MAPILPGLTDTDESIDATVAAIAAAGAARRTPLIAAPAPGRPGVVPRLARPRPPAPGRPLPRALPRRLVRAEGVPARGRRPGARPPRAGTAWTGRAPAGSTAALPEPAAARRRRAAEQLPCCEPSGRVTVGRGAVPQTDPRRVRHDRGRRRVPARGEGRLRRAAADAAARLAGHPGQPVRRARSGASAATRRWPTCPSRSTWSTCSARPARPPTWCGRRWRSAPGRSGCSRASCRRRAAGSPPRPAWTTSRTAASPSCGRSSASPAAVPRG